MHLWYCFIKKSVSRRFVTAKLLVSFKGNLKRVCSNYGAADVTAARKLVALSYCVIETWQPCLVKRAVTAGEVLTGPVATPLQTWAATRSPNTRPGPTFADDSVLFLRGCAVSFSWLSQPCGWFGQMTIEQHCEECVLCVCVWVFSSGFLLPTLLELKFDVTICLHRVT